MIFLYLSAVVLVCHATEQTRYDGHQVLKISPRTLADAQYVLQLIKIHGLDLWHVHRNENVFDVNVHQGVLDKVKQLLNDRDIPFSTWIQDIQSLIDTQFVSSRREKRAARNINLNRYNNFDTILAYMNNLDSDNPATGIRSETTNIGSSAEGRPIMLTKIYNSSSTTSKPAIFVDGGIHAREWISPAFVLYLIDQLKYQSSASPDVNTIVNAFDWYIVPVLNPDGYSFSHSNDRLWRKNRRINSNSACHGVDLNRNFGYEWNPAIGGSTSPCSDIFAGVGAFSEAESQAVRNFLMSGINFASYLTVHSYGQMWLYPWGYTSALPSDWQLLDAAAITATNKLYERYKTRYSVGSSTNVLYSAAGGSDDYAKGGAGIKYSYTLELRDTGRYGFVLPESLISATCLETMDAFIAFAQAIQSSQRKPNAHARKPYVLLGK